MSIDICQYLSHWSNGEKKRQNMCAVKLKQGDNDLSAIEIVNSLKYLKNSTEFCESLGKCMMHHSVPIIDNTSFFLP